MDNNTPPNDPYNPQNPQGYNPADEPDDVLEAARPSLGGGPGKAIVGGIVLFIILGFIISSMFSDDKKEKPQVDVGASQGDGEANIVAQGGPNDNASTPSAPLPPTPKSGALPPPPTPTDFDTPPLPTNGDGTTAGTDILGAPPPLENTGLEGSDSLLPPAPPPPPELKTLDGGPETDEKTQARIRSNMLVVDGGKDAPPDTEALQADANLNQGDANRAFSANVLSATKAKKETATRLSNLNYTIAQGKIVNAVLETAVNTDLPGTLRAIVSRDTYAEAGRSVLIPKGSRLIGTYNTGVVRGQKRVMIIWTRLIRPDGVDIAIGSSAVDNLGRAGIAGFVDNKYMELFSASVLTTVLSIGAAKISDEIVPSDGSTTTNTDGSSTTTNSAAAVAAASAVGDLSSVGKGVLQSLMDLRPTITIDQGTRISVFVNKDLTFPSTQEDGVFIQP